MDITHSIENEIVSKLSDIVYIDHNCFPIFIREFIYEGKVLMQRGDSDTFAFYYDKDDFKDLIDEVEYNYNQIEIDYNKRHVNDILEYPFSPKEEYICFNICKMRLYDPASIYIKKIHENIYISSEKTDKVYDIKYFSNAILGKLDEIKDNVKKYIISGLGKPFILCNKNQLSIIKKYAYDYNIEKDKYADVYDKRCEFIRKYGDIIIGKDIIGLYIDDLIKEDDDIILGLQTSSVSIGVQLYYYSLCEPKMQSRRVGYDNRFIVLRTPYDNKIYKRIKFFEHKESLEEIKKKEFNNRVNYFNKN